MAEFAPFPWLQALAVLGGAGTVFGAGIGLLFKVIVTDPIKRAHADADLWKSEYKAVVRSRREVRRSVESEELGAPSVPPPPPDEEIEDQTQRIRALDRADRDWEERRQADQLRRRAEALPRALPLEGLGGRKPPPGVDRELQRYHQDMASTPPDPAPIVPPRPRPKMPSRRG